VKPRRAVAAMTLAMLTVSSGAGLAACGGSSGPTPALPSSPAPSSSPASPSSQASSSSPALPSSPAPSSTPSPSASAPAPVATYGPGQTLPQAAVDALQRYFAAVAAGDAGAASAMLTPDSPLRDHPTMSIAAVRDVRVHRRPLPYPPKGGSAFPMVSAWVKGDPQTAWGPGGPHDFFMALTEAPAGVWRIDHLASGP